MFTLLLLGWFGPAARGEGFRVDSILRLPDGGIQLRAGEAPESCHILLGGAQVQAVTNLTNTVWQNVGSTVLLGNAGTARFIDLNATNHPIRFYRAYRP